MRIDRSRRSLRVLAVVAAASAALAACSSQGGARTRPPPPVAAGGGDTSGSNYDPDDHPRAGGRHVLGQDPGRGGGRRQGTRGHAAVLEQRERPRAGHAGAERDRQQGRRHRGHAVQRRRGDPGGQEGRRRPGIPVVVFNQGIDDYTKAGAKMYFGSDETLAGQTIGQKIASRDAGGKTLCIIQAQGSVALETRCAGREVRLREHREPAGQRRRPAVGAADDPVEAGRGPLDHQHRDPGRADRAGRACRPRGRRATPRRSPRST